MADAMETVVLRNKFYKDSSGKVMGALILAMVVNIGLATLIYYIFTHPPQPRYFATSINGRITPLFPLDEPNQSDAAILQWATTAGIASFSYNFVNYRTELQAEPHH